MKWIRDQWFLILLVVTLVSGFVLAPHCRALSETDWLKWLIVSITMFVMAWPLEFSRLRRSLTRPVAPLLASLLSLGLTPLLAWPWVGILGRELGGGLIVAAATPCTLASAAVWTRRAGGDDSVAILVTLLTNSVCFFVTPTWVYMLTGNLIARSEFIDTIYKLLFFVLFPLLAGQLMRLSRPSAAWATRHKLQLSVVAMFGILSMVFLGAIRTGLQMLTEQMEGFGARELLLTIALAAAIHVGVLWLGISIAKWLNFTRGEQIAVGFASSQKTLMVGLSTAINLNLNIIPIVAYHAIQLIVDTLVADHQRKKATELASPIARPTAGIESGLD